MLEVRSVSGGYPNNQILQDIHFTVDRGEIFGIIGPNGSGKTTLLKMISNTIKPTIGDILIDGKEIGLFSSKELARKVAVLPQQSETAFTYTVREIVALGRYAYQKGLFQTSSVADAKVVDEAMAQTNVSQFKDQSFMTLSGGERQRVLLARALAQEPQVLLLDEPTNHLDISYQMSLLDTLKEWTKTKKLTVIAILHDLNIASLYCDQVLLLDKGKKVELNAPLKMMKEAQLKEVYKTELQRHHHPSVARALITFQPNPEYRSMSNANSFMEELSVSRDDDKIHIASRVPWKTLSSAVIGAGFGWHRQFINRHVHKDYHCSDPIKEYEHYLSASGIDASETVGMMTAAFLSDGSIRTMKKDGLFMKVVVTAGTSNAVDVSRSFESTNKEGAGTINIWVFIDGHLSEGAFVQAMMTATEAKVKAMHDEKIIDPQSGTIATGTSTDSMVIAATQKGTYYEYAGTVTQLGSQIGKVTYEACLEAIQNNKRRR